MKKMSGVSEAPTYSVLCFCRFIFLYIYFSVSYCCAFVVLCTVVLHCVATWSVRESCRGMTIETHLYSLFPGFQVTIIRTAVFRVYSVFTQSARKRTESNCK